MNKEKTGRVLGDELVTCEMIKDIVWDRESYLDYTGEEKERLLESIIRAAGEDDEGIICNQLGAMYTEGKLAEQDYEKSFMWYRKASELAFPLGTSNLGFCYLFGRGTEKNYEEAFKCFAEAAALGSLDAYVRLGDMYFYGNYVEANYRKAFMMYSFAFRVAQTDLTDLAAYQVYSDAAVRLGDCFYYGRGVEKDYAAAFDCYSDACHFFGLREEMGDFYLGDGLKEAKEKLLKLVSELGNEVEDCPEVFGMLEGSEGWLQ